MIISGRCLCNKGASFRVKGNTMGEEYPMKVEIELSMLGDMLFGHSKERSVVLLQLCHRAISIFPGGLEECRSSR